MIATILIVFLAVVLFLYFFYGADIVIELHKGLFLGVEYVPYEEEQSVKLYLLCISIQVYWNY